MTKNTPYPHLEKFLSVWAKDVVTRIGGVRRKKVIRVRSSRQSADLITNTEFLIELNDEVRTLLVRDVSDASLLRTLTELGYRRESSDGGVAREWLTEFSHGLDSRLEARAGLLRPLVQAECERIGTPELARRIFVEEHSIAEFLGGALPSGTMVNALEAYDFGEYPDLRSSQAEHFHDSISIPFADGGWKEGVREFVEASSPGHVRGAISDVDALLERVPDEAGLRAILEDMGRYLPMGMSGNPCRAWLHSLREMLVELSQNGNDSAEPTGA